MKIKIEDYIEKECNLDECVGCGMCDYENFRSSIVDRVVDLHNRYYEGGYSIMSIKALRRAILGDNKS